MSYLAQRAGRLCLLFVSLWVMPACAGDTDAGPDSPAAPTAQVASPDRQALMKKAATGDPAAQFELGMALLHGDFGPQNAVDGRSWIQAAGKQRYPPAMAQMGRLYRDGLGGKTDPFLAVKWLRSSVEAGFRSAQIDLALMIAAGKGSHQDLVEAWVLLESASSTLALAPPGEYEEARRLLADLATRLTPEQMDLARKQLEDSRQESLEAMMRRNPGEIREGNAPDLSEGENRNSPGGE